MKSLMATSTRLTRSDSLMPIAIRVVRTATSSTAARLKWPQLKFAESAGPIEAGQVMPISSRKVTR